MPPSAYWPENAPWIIESTIWQGISGPQFNRLGPRVEQDYQAKGGHAWFQPFRAEFVPAWPALWAQAQQMFQLVAEGKLHYGVERLFADATARSRWFAALPAAGVLDWMAEHDHGIVCSDCGGLLIEAGGVPAKAKAAGLLWLPNVMPIPGQAIGCSPQDLRDQAIWLPAEQIC